MHRSVTLMILSICREDVSKAVSKMDRKSVEHAVAAIRKRLDKHFLASAEVAVSVCCML